MLPVVVAGGWEGTLLYFRTVRCAALTARVAAVWIDSSWTNVPDRSSLDGAAYSELQPKLLPRLRHGALPGAACHNPGMSALLAALVGGALAIGGALAGALATGRGQRDRWRRDTQLRVSTELLSSLQQMIRRAIHLAYLTEKPPRDTPIPGASAHFDASGSWNSSIYAALLVSPPKIADLVQGLDREVDRLLGRAREKQWSQHDFREERRALGRLAAAYLNAARVETGWSPIPIESIWAWDKSAELGWTFEAGEPDPNPQPAD
jgi:hypothetical protein